MVTMFGAILCAIEAAIMGFIIYGMTGMLEDRSEVTDEEFVEEFSF